MDLSGGAAEGAEGMGEKLMEAAKNNPQLAALLMGIPAAAGGVALKRRMFGK
jgi:hypothetical protein